MFTRFIRNWRALPVGDKRRIIVMGIEFVINAATLWAAFVIFMAVMCWGLARLGVA